MKRNLNVKWVSIVVFVLLTASCVKNRSEFTPDNLVVTESSNSIGCDTICIDTPTELKMTEEMIRLKKLQQDMLRVKGLRSLDYREETYDDTYWQNMFAIRELPATIKVRTIASKGSSPGYLNFYCTGKSKEVVLNNANHPVYNRFYIKILPSSSGIPYLIYSKAAETPLSVGYYNSNPNDKILMASSGESSSLWGAGWDLKQSTNYKNYYAIESQSYLGQADPNIPYSVFHYVLEAVSGNKIRYSKRVQNKGQQEFQITPDAKFTLISLEYDVEQPSVTRSTFKKTVTVKNLSEIEKSINVPFEFDELENSYFNKNSWSVNLQFANSGIKFARPTIIKGILIYPEPTAVKDATFVNTGYQNINRHISYSFPIRCKANSIAKVTATFVKYRVSTKYIAKAQYKDPDSGELRECILKGTWNGSIIEDPTEVIPKSNIVFIPLDDNDDIILEGILHK